MPWKKRSEVDQRYDLVRQIKDGRKPVAVVCREFGVSRPTAYKWVKRYQTGRLPGLRNRSRKARSNKGRTPSLWLRRVRRLRLRQPTWGARKLRAQLQRVYGSEGGPATATISRWLRCWGLTRGQRRRLRGPVVLRKGLHVPTGCHQVWTTDFKGSYRTGNGQRIHPLTVRELYSRYGLAIVVLKSTSIGETRRVFETLFRRHGLPQRIRCDKGAPFGGTGPTGLTRLSAWWLKLGIEVEFIRPGRPCENGAHEQFHRIYKAEVAARPAANGRAQQRRGARWLRHYNHHRPHEALGNRTPGEVYRKNRRKWRPAKGWKYPRNWIRRWVKGNGEIAHRGQRRYVGEALVRDYVGLKPLSATAWQVYFGPLVVGELRESETGRIRMARYRYKKRKACGPRRSGSLRSPARRGPQKVSTMR